MNNTVGEKIRNFRKRAGISQLELEMRIGTSPGSISRIESGEVNPTKETLLKIIDALDLVSIEATSLFDIETNISSLLKIPSELLNSKDLNEILRKSVNIIVAELNLLSAFITVRKGNKLYSLSTTDRWFNKIVFKIIPVPFHELNVDLITDKDNLCVKSFLEQKIFISNSLEEFTVPAVSPNLVGLMNKVTGFKSGIVFPIMYKGESLGTFFTGKNFYDDFRSEIPILKEFTNYIGEAIAKINNS